MKLIITGASGFVATELLRQSLRHPSITSVVAISRRPVPQPTGLPANELGKLRVVQVKDYGELDVEQVREAAAGAGGCIWTVAVTPSKQGSMPFAEVKKICQDDALAGLNVLSTASGSSNHGNGKPFRFIYMSGVAAERDQSKKPWFKPEYTLMRGKAETEVLAYAANSAGKVECAVAKPGLIQSPGWSMKRLVAPLLWLYASLPTVEVGDCAAAILASVVDGLGVETMENADLVRMGREASRAGRG
ncbi:MAG: hypothetical protein OHK93_006346 [Ramalina farinacea]|uniref:NAD(P)-binding domain-containing protein n=1 Tax=Ramalina farinacea TaxID=258253 RepID=A0AA43TSY8_9LECA|nr:hypothetical protein [Ramalina farinacea]